MLIKEVCAKEQKQEISLQILNSLPQWFGIPEAILEYVTEARDMPFVVAYVGDKAVGYVALKQQNAFSAEIYVMGILPEFQRQGIGKALAEYCIVFCQNNKTEYLQVKTLDESHPDENYAKTRAFYFAMGFRPLECFPTLWDKSNPCLVMVRKI